MPPQTKSAATQTRASKTAKDTALRQPPSKATPPRVCAVFAIIHEP